MAAIEVRGLAKRFRDVTALAEVDLEVGSGETVVILGPNGAGKTTLLRILATVVLPDQGKATVEGRDVVTQPAEVRRVVGAVLGDERSWYWRLTGRQNLEFFAALHGCRRTAAVSVADRLLADVDLTSSADRPVGTWSSGMRARLSVARALVGDPSVLLLDEPTRSLDPVAAADVRTWLRRLTSQRSVAVLLVSHDLHEAAGIADRVFLLAEGHLQLLGEGPFSAEQLERSMLTALGS